MNSYNFIFSCVNRNDTQLLFLNDVIEEINNVCFLANRRRKIMLKVEVGNFGPIMEGYHFESLSKKNSTGDALPHSFSACFNFGGLWLPN